MSQNQSELRSSVYKEQVREGYACRLCEASAFQHMHVQKYTTEVLSGAKEAWGAAVTSGSHRASRRTVARLWLTKGLVTLIGAQLKALRPARSPAALGCFPWKGLPLRHLGRRRQRRQREARLLRAAGAFVPAASPSYARSIHARTWEPDKIVSVR
eukprot:363842-Chlamydomonas_euryale.AAC.4